jgi:hypothetical protein
MEWQYFSGDCSSPAAQQQAKENFIQGVKEVIGNGDPNFCQTMQVCDLESIRVVCGKTQSRKRSLGFSVSKKHTFLCLWLTEKVKKFEQQKPSKASKLAGYYRYRI